MCVEIVMMILMMISAKDIPRVLGAHKVTKRVRKEKNLSSLCPLPHETTSNQQKMEETKKKTCEKKKGKKGKATFTVLHVWVEGVGFKNQK